MSCYSPEDFLVPFTSSADLVDVLHGPVPVGTPFFLVWKRWRRQSLASAGAMRHKVLIAMKGMPAHTWDVSTAERILCSSCARLEEAPQTVARDDLREYFVAAWCIHPRFIPQQKIIAIPEPEVPVVVEAPLYLRAHEMVRSELPALRYLVRIRVVETQDWTSPPSSSGDDAPGDSDDSNEPYWMDRGQRGCSGPWPRRHRFSNGDGGSNAGGAQDDRLGPGWGPTFQHATPVLVGSIPCPVQPGVGPQSPARDSSAKRPAPVEPEMPLQSDPVHSSWAAVLIADEHDHLAGLYA